MKTNIKQKEESKGYTFPCLFISKDEDMIVYIVDEGFTGVVLHSRISDYPEGYSSIWKKEEFVLFKGAIELSND